jgi:hypothetical protein
MTSLLLTDWDMPHEHLKYAVDVWKGHFFNRLVGFSHQGRNHVRQRRGLLAQSFRALGD